MVDFGMDLAAAIIMFEKPMGIWAILEEESLFPKATDKSFEEKLKASLGKLPVFLKPQSKTDKNAHFAISHYAGIVSYNVTGWLEKNKDPVNDSVVEVMKSQSTDALLVLLWEDHPGQPTTAPKEEGKKKKKGGGKTVSSVYLVSLVELMTTLYSCEPHFVRCLVPTTAQVELNKKRESEVNKLRKDVEEANIQQESILFNLKRKQGDATAEMTEQIDALGKMKSKIEKDKVLIMNEIADARATTDEVMRAQASADMSNKKMLETLNAINKKVDDANLTLGDFASNKNKISCENSDLLRIVGDLDNNLNILAKQKAALAAQLNDVKALCDNEARERGLLLGKYRNLEHELDGARCALEEEAAGRENTLRLVAKGEELEMTKMKLTARLTEAGAAIDNLNAKLNQVEKAKGKIGSEISEMSSSLDQAQVLNAAMERKAKQFDKVIGEWKGKVDRLSYDLDVSQKETR